MKGLLIKDLKIVLNNNRTFLLMAMAIVFFFAFMDDPSFVVGYVTVLCSILVLGTLSYDELDNGFAFIFTLPVSRKNYVQSKYIFAGLYTFVVWLMASIILFVIENVKGLSFDPAYNVGVLVSCYVLLAIMIPVQLKFGTEKTRIALAIIVGALFAICAGIVLILIKIGIFPEDIASLGENMSELTNVIIALILIVIAAIVLMISYVVSVKILNKREF